MKPISVCFGLMLLFIACRKDQPMPILKIDSPTTNFSKSFTGTWKVVSVKFDNHNFLDSFNTFAIFSNYDWNCSTYFYTYQTAKFNNPKFVFEKFHKGEFEFYDTASLITHSPIITNCLPLNYSSSGYQYYGNNGKTWSYQVDSVNQLIHVFSSFGQYRQPLIWRYSQPDSNTINITQINKGNGPLFLNFFYLPYNGFSNYPFKAESMILKRI